MFLPDIFYWQWFSLGFILLALELFMPGTFLLWIGLAGITMGVVTWFIQDILVTAQLILFGCLTLLSVYVWYKFFRKRAETSAQPVMNERGKQYIGKTYILKDPIVEGLGRLTIDDTYWTVRGEDLDAGKKVTVVAKDGPILIVKKAK